MTYKIQYRENCAVEWHTLGTNYDSLWHPRTMIRDRLKPAHANLEFRIIDGKGKVMANEATGVRITLEAKGQ